MEKDKINLPIIILAFIVLILQMSVTTTTVIKRYNAPLSYNIVSIVIILIFRLIFAYVTKIIADRRNRDPNIALLFGITLGLIGLIVYTIANFIIQPKKKVKTLNLGLYLLILFGLSIPGFFITMVVSAIISSVVVRVLGILAERTLI